MTAGHSAEEDAGAEGNKDDNQDEEIEAAIENENQSSFQGGGQREMTNEEFKAFLSRMKTQADELKR